MKAKLLPLKGKYYGTLIEIDFDDNNKTTEEIKLWCDGDYTPSERHLNKFGYTKQQWDNNEHVTECGWDSNTHLTPIRQLDLVCDSHFESDLTYK